MSKPRINKEPIPIPYLSTPYRNVMKPQPAVFAGPDSPSYTAGTLYQDWIYNDFTILKGNDGAWHAFGITHPRPEDFVDAFHYSNETIHEASYELFHGVWDSKLEELLTEGQFRQEKNVLPAAIRPGERPECWSPCCVEKDGKYYMIYCPQDFRLGTSTDLYDWKPEGILFSGVSYMRDPYIIREGDLFYMLYVENNLQYRTSTDLYHWSEPEVFQKPLFSAMHGGMEIGIQESPIIFKHGDYYYLLWSIWDGRNGAYDWRTFVFASETITGFNNGSAPITMLEAHASEVVHDGEDAYILSVFHPENGLNISKLGWKQAKKE